MVIQLGGGGTGLESQHLGGRGRQISQFEASLVYRVSSRTARATQRNPISKKTKRKKERKKMIIQTHRKLSKFCSTNLVIDYSLPVLGTTLLYIAMSYFFKAMS